MNQLNVVLVILINYHSRLDHLLELARSGHRPHASSGEAAVGGHGVDVAVAPHVDHVLTRVGDALQLQLVVLKHLERVKMKSADIKRAVSMCLRGLGTRFSSSSLYSNT